MHLRSHAPLEVVRQHFHAKSDLQTLNHGQVWIVVLWIRALIQRSR